MSSRTSPQTTYSLVALAGVAILALAMWWLLEINLETGRTHQIRVQAASRGHPILGDQLYDSAVPFGPETSNDRERAIALHARSLTFRHPTTHEDCTVIAPVPETWNETMHSAEP